MTHVESEPNKVRSSPVNPDQAEREGARVKFNAVFPAPRGVHYNTVLPHTPPDSREMAHLLLKDTSLGHKNTYHKIP